MAFCNSIMSHGKQHELWRSHKRFTLIILEKKLKPVIPSVGEDCVENRFSALFLGILTDPINLRTIWQHLVRLKIGTVSGPVILFLKTKLHVGAKRHTKLLIEALLLHNRN